MSRLVNIKEEGEMFLYSHSLRARKATTTLL